MFLITTFRKVYEKCTTLYNTYFLDVSKETEQLERLSEQLSDLCSSSKLEDRIQHKWKKWQKILQISAENKVFFTQMYSFILIFLSICFFDRRCVISSVSLFNNNSHDVLLFSKKFDFATLISCFCVYYVIMYKLCLNIQH